MFTRPGIGCVCSVPMSHINHINRINHRLDQLFRPGGLGETATSQALLRRRAAFGSDRKPVEGQNHGLSYSYSCCSCYSWEMVEMVGRKPPARFSVWITFFFSSQISHIDDTGATQKSGTTAGGQQRLRGKLAGHRGPFLGVTMCDTRMGSLPQIHSNRHSIWRYYEGIWGHILYINIYIYLHHYHGIPMLPMLPWEKTLSFFVQWLITNSYLLYHRAGCHLSHHPLQALENFHTEALEMVRKNAAAQIETEWSVAEKNSVAFSKKKRMYEAIKKRG